MENLQTGYEKFDFSGDLNVLKTSVLGADLEKIKNILQNPNLDEAQKSYIEARLGGFLNNFLQKAKSDPNSYNWSSWQIIKDLELQNLHNPDIQTLIKISNMSFEERQNFLPQFFNQTNYIKIFSTQNNINLVNEKLENQTDFPKSFAIQKKQNGKNISLFGYSASIPSLNKFLTQKQNDFIKDFNKLILSGKNQNFDRKSFSIIAKNYGLEYGEYTFFVENSAGAFPYINISYGDNIGVSFGKNTLVGYENLIPLVQDLPTKTDIQISKSQNVIPPNGTNKTKTSTPSQQPISYSEPKISSQPAPDPLNDINHNVVGSKPIGTQAPLTKTQNFEQKKLEQNIQPNEKNSFNPALQKELEAVAKNSLTAIDLANLTQKDFFETETKKLNQSPKQNLETGVGGNMGMGSVETKKLKTDLEKKQYLEKLFDGKTVFNIPNSQKIIFETGSKNLGNTYLQGAKLYLKGVTLEDVEGEKLVYANVSNIVYNGNQQSKTNYRVNLGELNQVISQVDSWKNIEKTPYTQLEVGEYNSNKVYNQMIAILNMQQNQIEKGGIKNGESFSYLKYFDIKNILTSGEALPGYYTYMGKSGDDIGTIDGGGICASANLLFTTAGLGANGAILNEYKFLKSKDGKVSGTRIPRQVSLGSGAKDIFTNLNFSNHSQHYYNITSDNPLVGEGRKFDATVSDSGPDLKFVNNSGKTLYIHMKVTILDGGVIKNDPREKGDNNLRGLYDNSTTWFNQCWIDDKAPTLDEINHNKEQFKKFLNRRPWMKRPKTIGF